MEKENIQRDYSEFVKKYKWLIRPCEDYAAEARECKHLKSRFHQYYINGTFTDCSAWVKDSINCEKCFTEKNDTFCREIINNERERRLKRYEGHLNNDVWEKREKPPDDWNKELPEWWLKQNNSSFKELKGEFEEFIAHNEPKKQNAFCVIL